MEENEILESLRKLREERIAWEYKQMWKRERDRIRENAEANMKWLSRKEKSTTPWVVKNKDHSWICNFFKSKC